MKFAARDNDDDMNMISKGGKKTRMWKENWPFSPIFSILLGNITMFYDAIAIILIVDVVPPYRNLLLQLHNFMERNSLSVAVRNDALNFDLRTFLLARFNGIWVRQFHWLIIIVLGYFLLFLDLRYSSIHFFLFVSPDMEDKIHMWWKKVHLSNYPLPGIYTNCLRREHKNPAEIRAWKSIKNDCRLSEDFISTEAKKKKMRRFVDEKQEHKSCLLLLSLSTPASKYLIIHKFHRHFSSRI